MTTATQQDNLRAAVAKVLTHPLRLRIAEAMDSAEDGLSPGDLSEEWGVPLGNVSYHFRALYVAKLLGKPRTKQVRGALAHYYRLTPLGQDALAAAQKVLGGS